MTAGAGPGPGGSGHDPDAPPVAVDRPVVDGTARSSDDLRAEVRRHGDPDRNLLRDNARIREDLGATARELAARLDVRARSRAEATRLRDTALTAGRAHTGLLAGAGAVAAVVLAVVLRRARTTGSRRADRR